MIVSIWFISSNYPQTFEYRVDVLITQILGI